MGKGNDPRKTAICIGGSKIILAGGGENRDRLGLKT